MKTFKEFCQTKESNDKSELYKLTRKAMQSVPGSKHQQDLLKKVNQERSKHNLKPLKLK